MQLEHIALNVFDSNEVNSFYENILGFTQIKNFNIDKDLAQYFFNIDKDASAFLMQNDELFFELFVNNNYMNNSFSHVCIKVNDREKMVEKAIANSYKYIRRERDHFDQIFISDKSGNIFELKERL